MPKDHPRMRRFWWTVFCIISALWTLYGLFIMAIGLIVDPLVRWIVPATLVTCGLFGVALAWTPTRRLAIRHGAWLYALGAAMVGLSLCFLLREQPPPVLSAGIALMIGGGQILLLPWLLRNEKERL